MRSKQTKRIEFLKLQEEYKRIFGEGYSRWLGHGDYESPIEQMKKAIVDGKPIQEDFYEEDGSEILY